MKKLHVICLVFVLVFMMLVTACSPKAGIDSTQEGTASSNESAAETKTNLEPYEIVWYYDGPGPQKDVNLIQDEMNKYLKDKINVTVKLNALDWGTYDQKMQVVMTSGEKVDLAFTCAWAMDYQNGANKGWYTDITDLLPKYAPDAYNILNDPENNWITPNLIGGKLYAMAVNKEAAGATGLLVNTDLATKHGMDLNTIKSIEDLKPVFEKVKKEDPTVIEMVMSKNLNRNHSGFKTFDHIVVNGVTSGFAYNYDADKYQSVFDLPEYMDQLKKIREYYELGYINKDASTLDDYTIKVKTGKVLCYPAPLKPGKDLEESKAVGVPLKQIVLSDYTSGLSYRRSAMMAVPKSSQDPARALMFYNYFYSDPYMINLIDYGIEGTHWEWLDKDNKVIQFAANTNEGKNSGWNPGTNWMFGDQFKSYFFKGEDLTKWEQFKEWNSKAITLKNDGFSFNESPFKKEIAAITNVARQFEQGLMTGSLDPVKYVPQYQEKLKAAGMDTVIEGLNKQYEEWKKNK